MVTSSKDGKLGFWNCKDSYKQLSMIKYSKNEAELNAVQLISSPLGPCAVVGGASGSLSFYDVNNGKVLWQ